MLYFLRFEVHQPEGMPSKQFYEIWSREAEAALTGVRAGKVKALYKVSGRRTALAVVDAMDHDELDRPLAGSPIMRELGGSVEVEVLPIRPYENFAEEMKRVLAKM
ncbi:MAG: MIase like protein [candidate division NC10 bacterium]|nr:MIase like protein [candidate division NC10 bacterium]